MAIRVVVVGEVCFYRDGLAQVLDKRAGLEVVAGAGNTDDALILTSELSFDVALVDMGMTASLLALRGIRDRVPEARLVALAIRDSEDDVVACAEAGAMAYVTRDTSLEDLVNAVEAAGRRETLCSPKVAAVLSQRVAALAMSRRPLPPPDRLTAREQQIAHLLKRGLSNKEIARNLYIELATVKNHVHNIFDKLGIHRRSEVTPWVLGDLALSSEHSLLPDAIERELKQASM